MAEPADGCLILSKHPVIYPSVFDERQFEYVRDHPEEKNFSPVVMFKTAEDCEIRYGSVTARRELMFNVEDLTARFDESAIEHVRSHLPLLFDPEPDVPDTGRLAEDTWALMVRVARRYGYTQVTVEAGTKAGDNYRIELDLIQAAKLGEYRGYPRQAAIILDALLRAGQQYYHEEDLLLLMNQLVGSGTIRTRQDPWRIFQYYRPQMIDDNIIIRGG